MDSLSPLMIQIVSGMVGGGVAGVFVKQAAMAILPRLVAGAVGGIGGGAALGPIIAGLLGGDPSAGMDASNIAGDIAGGLLGGGVLAALAGMVIKQR